MWCIGVLFNFIESFNYNEFWYRTNDFYLSLHFRSNRLKGPVAFQRKIEPKVSCLIYSV